MVTQEPFAFSAKKGAAVGFLNAKAAVNLPLNNEIRCLGIEYMHKAFLNFLGKHIYKRRENRYNN